MYSYYSVKLTLGWCNQHCGGRVSKDIVPGVKYDEENRIPHPYPKVRISIPVLRFNCYASTTMDEGKHVTTLGLLPYVVYSICLIVPTSWTYCTLHMTLESIWYCGPRSRLEVAAVHMVYVIYCALGSRDLVGYNIHEERRWPPTDFSTSTAHLGSQSLRLIATENAAYGIVYYTTVLLVDIFVGRHSSTHHYWVNVSSN